MLITFKSNAAADVLMYKVHAKPLLDLLGKDPDQGIITAEEMPAAVARLEDEVALSKRPPPSPANDGTSSAEDEDLESGKKVSFAARAFPLLEMMRAAKQENTFVMWGV
jgi:Domain of unknown function (DUF1840)